MYLIKNSYPIQQLATGESLTLHAYTFKGSSPGPIIYLQGNIHGPEIFGTALLTRLLSRLTKYADIPGSLTVVPCANPIGVQSTSYDTLVGRWNMHNGTNWNRIFPIDTSWKNPEECSEYCKQKLLAKNLSVEDKLATTLRLLSAAATHTIDIHTAGSQCEPHVFTHEQGHAIFAHLGANIHLEWKEADALGTFDESCVLPFQRSSDSSHTPIACTWEAYHHNAVDENILKDRLQRLENCIHAMWGKTTTRLSPPTIYPISHAYHLVAPISGYYAWNKKVGERIEKGEQYATVYQPWTGQSLPLCAEQSWILLSIFGVQATPEGEQIAWVVTC